MKDMNKEMVFELVKAEHEMLMARPKGACENMRIAKIDGQVIGMLKAFRMMGVITNDEATEIMNEII